MFKVPTGPPLNVSLISRTSTSLEIGWSPVRKNETNGRIIDYNVHLFEPDGIFLEKTWELHVNVTGLKVHSNYTVQVQAFTSKGAGPNSSQIIVTTMHGAGQ